MDALAAALVAPPPPPPPPPSLSEGAAADGVPPPRPPEPPVDAFAASLPADGTRPPADGPPGLEFQVAPPALGRVRVRLESTGGGLTGVLTVASVAAREVVESRLPELSRQLEGAGIGVASVRVVLAPPAVEARRGPAPRPVPRPGSRRRTGRLDVTA